MIMGVKERVEESWKKVVSVLTLFLQAYKMNNSPINNHTQELLDFFDPEEPTAGRWRSLDGLVLGPGIDLVNTYRSWSRVCIRCA